MMYFIKLQFIFVLKILLATGYTDPAGNQLAMYKNKTCDVINILTTSAGRPTDYTETNTLNKKLITNSLFFESISHFGRENIPERVVHTKGTGAFGHFIVTDDVTDLCEAKFLNKIGKITKIAVRFSLISKEKGAPDTSVDGRGFAVKFYTEDGNFDLVGLNTETFFIKDPNIFVSLTRAMKRNPATNFKDPTMMWDFLTLHTETLNTFLFAIITTPNGYRHMPGFGVHTFQLVNKDGDIHFVRFHLTPDLGIKNLTLEEASKIASEDPDYNGRDLYNAIANSNFPSWTVSIQVFNINEVNNTDIFDITKRISKKTHPLRRIGRIILKRNPVNNHADVELLAFNPAHLVPGIIEPLDSLFLGRLLAYNNAIAHRLGPNFNKIPVNYPLNKSYTYLRDGYPPVNDNMADAPNYYPNSFNGPIASPTRINFGLSHIHENQPDNMDQTRDFYLNAISESERQVIMNYVINSLSSVPKFIQDRALNVLKLVDPVLSDSVQKGLQEILTKKNNSNSKNIKKAAKNIEGQK